MSNSSIERLRDLEDSHRAVMREECAGDEVHCSCVPPMRAEVERLRAKVKGFETAPLHIAMDVLNDRIAKLEAEVERLREITEAQECALDAAHYWARKVLECKPEAWITYKTDTE